MDQLPGGLLPGEVHAWLVDLDAPGHGFDAVLDPAERRRAAAYLRGVDGRRFAASRAALRILLSSYLPGTPAHLPIRTAPGGGLDLAGSEVRVSLSRSAGIALIAVSRGRVGADIAAVVPRPGLADLVAARFGKQEAACVAACGGGSALRGFYRHWTAKEAYLKAVGTTLAAGLRTTELVCGKRPQIWSAGTPAIGWKLSWIDVVPAHVAAIMAAGPVTRCGWLPAHRRSG